MITQRMVYNNDGSAYLMVLADPAGLPELVALADELKLRSTVTTQGSIHRLNDPQGNGGMPSVPDL